MPRIYAFFRIYEFYFAYAIFIPKHANLRNITAPLHTNIIYTYYIKVLSNKNENISLIITPPPLLPSPYKDVYPSVVSYASCTLVF